MEAATIYIIIGIISILFIIIAFCITVHAAIRMREAFLRGKMLQQRCGEEYYEAETIRYQIYDEWINKKANEELGASSWILIVATMAVVILYIGKFIIDNWGNWDDAAGAGYSKLGFIGFTKGLMDKRNWLKLLITIFIIAGTITYCLYTALILNPNQGAKGYYTDGDLAIGNRIGGVSTHLVLLLIVLPFGLIWANSGKGNSSSNQLSVRGVFDAFIPNKTPYVLLLLVLVGLLIFAFLNVGYGVYIKDAIHSDYYDERINTADTIRLPTHILQKVINNAVKTVGDVTIAAEYQQKSTNDIYNTEKYKFYKMIYNGIRDVDKPNSVSEGDIKKGTYVDGNTQPVYPLMFKYILHSKTMDKLLRDPNVLSTAIPTVTNTTSIMPNIDVTDIYKNMGSSDESLGQAVNNFYTAVMIIFGAIVGIIVLIIYRNVIQSNPMYTIPIVSIVFLLMLGSLIYAYMSGVLLG